MKSKCCSCWNLYLLLNSSRGLYKNVDMIWLVTGTSRQNSRDPAESFIILPVRTGCIKRGIACFFITLCPELEHFQGFDNMAQVISSWHQAVILLIIYLLGLWNGLMDRCIRHSNRKNLILNIRAYSYSYMICYSGYYGQHKFPSWFVIQKRPET